MWARAKEIVADAAEAAPQLRAALVQERCGSDLALLAEVNSLLVGLTGIEGYFEKPALAPSEGASGPVLEPGLRLGAYALDHEVGHGGMGVVWAAHRVDGAYQQRVAVKLLINQSARDVRRMERERQWLAQLNHPGIARLMDGGNTPQGTPYLVMEFVDGLPIDQYCRNQALGLRERVLLVRQVCLAVQSAHQSAIIHRDIKPSNILVTATGETKLLDFGIARLLTDDIANADLTLAHALPFTPRYASPEQVKGAAVTVATDVHGLGLLLYELLCGASPYARLDADRDNSLTDAIVALTQDEPRSLSAVAQHRGLPPPEVRALRGELDAIALKACAKLPQTRYATVAQFDDDLRRWLEGDAVLARQPSRGRIAWKFLRKHWVASALVAGALVLVLVSLAVALWQWQRSEQALGSAQIRLATVRDFNRSVLDSVGTRLSELPGGLAVKQSILKGVLDNLNRVAEGANEDLEFLGDLAIAYERIAEMQGNDSGLSLGEGAEAESNARRAIALAQRAWPVKRKNLEFVQAYANMHTVRALQARVQGRLEDALAELRSTQDILQSGLQEFPDAPRLLAPLAQSWLYMGQVLDGGLSRPSLMQPRAALPWYDKAQTLLDELYRREPLPALLHELGTVHGARARSQVRLGQWAAACASAYRSVEALQGEFASGTGMSARAGLAVELANAADCEMRRGAYAQAEALMQRSSEHFDVLADAEPGAQKWRQNRALAGAVLGRALLAQGKLERVQTLLRSALAEMPHVDASAATVWLRRSRSIGRSLVLADLAALAWQQHRSFEERALAQAALSEVEQLTDQQPQLVEAWAARARLEAALHALDAVVSGRAGGNDGPAVCRSLHKVESLRALTFDETKAKAGMCP